MPRLRPILPRLALPLALILLPACGSEPASKPAPQPAAKPEPPKPEPPKPEPEAPPPTPEPEPEPVPEGCKVVIEGASEDEAVKRALINTKSGAIYDTTVEDGKTIVFECPPLDERKGTNIIAEQANAKLVHWAEVDVGPEAGDQTLDAADAKPDLPEGLDEETLARLQAKWPDLSKWEEEEAEAGGDTPAPKPKDSPPPPAKVPVSFSAHKLYWAELKLQNKQTKKIARLVLDPKGKKSLAPGTYALAVKLEAEGSWQDAGELVIEAGEASYSVQMLDGPPRPKVTSK